MHVETQVWEAAGGGAPRTTFVMIPGNPGAVEPYAEFMDALWVAAGGQLRLVTLGHTAHSARSLAAAPPGSAARGPHALAAQIAHKRAYLRALLATTPRTRLLLGGHSVGAHVAVELLRDFPAVPRAVLLFPTLSNIAATPNGVRLSPLFAHGRGLARALVSAVRLLPARARRAAVARFAGPGADARAVDVLVDAVLHPDVMDAALHMAHTEMRDITALDAAHVGAVAGKLAMYYGAADRWVNAADIADVEARFPAARVTRCAEGHGHAFVLSAASSARLAEHTWDCVRGDVGGGSRAAR